MIKIINTLSVSAMVDTREELVDVTVDTDGGRKG